MDAPNTMSIRGDYLANVRLMVNEQMMVMVTGPFPLVMDTILRAWTNVPDETKRSMASRIELVWT